jgi:hypothetical protein
MRRNIRRSGIPAIASAGRSSVRPSTVRDTLLLAIHPRRRRKSTPAGDSRQAASNRRRDADSSLPANRWRSSSLVARSARTSPWAAHLTTEHVTVENGRRRRSPTLQPRQIRRAFHFSRPAPLREFLLLRHLGNLSMRRLVRNLVASIGHVVDALQRSRRARHLHRKPLAGPRPGSWLPG